nr:hypothetical protein OH820_34960 [Streptomyces sp. NBC_00857]
MEFTVLPDNYAGASIGALLYGTLSREHHGVEVLAHSSGRPWIVGRWHSDELVTATVGDRHVALLGLTHVDAAELAGAGAVPQHVLGRQTKGEHSEDIYAGLRRHRPELLTLTDDMRLARMGLVDARVFRSALVGPHPYSHNIALLLSTLSCEVWL